MSNKIKAPRKASKLDGWRLYANRTMEIKQHNQELLECILEGCPENHIVVVSQTMESFDPLKWIEGKNHDNLTGIHAFVPGIAVAQALPELSVESTIRRFWYIQVSSEQQP